MLVQGSVQEKRENWDTSAINLLPLPPCHVFIVEGYILFLLPLVLFVLVVDFPVVSVVGPPTLMMYIVEEHAVSVWWNRTREIEEHHDPPHPANNEFSISFLTMI